MEKGKKKAVGQAADQPTGQAAGQAVGQAADQLEIDLDREINDVKGVLKLDQNVIAAVAGRGKDALVVGGFVLFISGVAAAVGSALILSEVNLSVMIQAGLSTIIVWLLYIGLIQLIASKVFGGQAPWSHLAKPLLYGLTITWLNVIVALGFITVWWMLAVTYRTLRVVHKLDTNKAILSIFGTFLVAAILGVISGVDTLFGD